MIVFFKNKYMNNKLKKLINAGFVYGENCKFAGAPLIASEPYLVKLGNHVSVSGEVLFITHDGSSWILREFDEEMYGAIKFGPIIVGNNVFLGARSTILPNVTIGDNVIVGTSSLVNKDLESNFVYAGVPAKKIMSIQEYKESLKQKKTILPDEVYEDKIKLKFNYDLLKKQLTKLYMQ